jgi:dihydrofolate reductase
MSSVILYIAASLDGFIAGPGGDLEWLNTLPNPDNSDHGYAAFYSKIGATVMGRKTYDEILDFGVDWPYRDVLSYVVTRDSAFAPSTPDTTAVRGDLPGLIQSLKARLEDKDIWLVGGGQLITAFLSHNLIDGLIITHIPVILGQGIPLFPGKHPASSWQLTHTESFASGAVSVTYARPSAGTNRK